MKNAISERLHITEGNPIRARFFDYDYFRYPWHFHSQYEIIHVREGFGLCYAGDRVEKFGSGDLIFFGSNLPHYMRSDEIFLTDDPDLRVRGTIIQFESEFMSYSIGNYPQLMSIKEFLAQSHRGFIFPGVRCPRITGLLREFPVRDGFRQIVGLLDLLQRMATHEDKRAIASPLHYETFPVQGDERIEKIIAYINGNYTDPRLCLEDVASKAAMNTSAFCRYFRQRVGKPFVGHVAEMRVAHACKLLALKRLGISRIAMECGFGSVGNFNRTFKRVTSFTPTQYRSRIGLL